VEIGPPTRTYTVEPVEDPVPRDAPDVDDEEEGRPDLVPEEMPGTPQPPSGISAPTRIFSRA